jgi:hypothetical protein
VPLTAEQRRELPDDAFAVPSKRALPIHDARHVRMAWSQVERTKDLTDDEKTEARHRIKEKADSLGVDTAGWEMKAEADTGLYVSRPLTPESAAAFLEWARTQGFTKHMPAGELHVTLVSSEVSAELSPHEHEVRIEGGDRSVVRIGDGGPSRCASNPRSCGPAGRSCWTPAPSPTSRTTCRTSPSPGATTPWRWTTSRPSWATWCSGLSATSP